MKEIYEMKGAGRSMRGITGDPGIARNTVHRNLKSPDSMRPKPRSRRASKLWPHTEYVDRRVPEGAGKLRGPAPGAQGPGLCRRLLHPEVLRVAAPATPATWCHCEFVVVQRFRPLK